MLDVAINAAQQAGAFLKERMGKVRVIETKGGNVRDLVSEIDRASEQLIIGIITSRYPHHAILAEESGGGVHAADYRWVIDPLDGTINYIHGVPVFCVTIAIEKKGEIVAGVVYDPNLKELFTAEKGSGAFLNGKRLQVSYTHDLISSLLVTGFPYDIARNPDHAVEHFVHFLPEARGIRRLGSAALDLSYVAAGRFDGFWEVSLNPWDMAAGSLFVLEAGGKVTDFSGNPASIYKKQIVASNVAIHEAMLKVLAKTTTAS
jgi:myo-inositol-1(or 4)-monophosphatase